jgi:hypothetical protein
MSVSQSRHVAKLPATLGLGSALFTKSDCTQQLLNISNHNERTS